MTSYKTIRQEAFDEFIVNKSRFIGYACPCETEDEAQHVVSNEAKALEEKTNALNYA